MCKLTVELHRGRIWVEPGAGGNKFIFTIAGALAPTAVGAEPGKV
jgi:hypothetical protein